jgi:SAM-dependent methyltransferase
LRILELGSGPGHLAKHILENCTASHYAALDFSDAMHGIARENLKGFTDKVSYLTRDFRRADWADGLADFDAVVTMQAAHKTRHKRHLPGFLVMARDTLRVGGLFLYSDHYAEAGSGKNEQLYLPRDEQAAALVQAGLKDVDCLLMEGGMALYRGAKA